MDFSTILEECRARYTPFQEKVVLHRHPRSFEKAILEGMERGVNPIITEIKAASPSGRIASFSSVREVSEAMVRGGACALSILTEERYFQGRLSYLQEVSQTVQVPLLRKDFLFDLSQVEESYYYGADSLLLIASFFTAEELSAFLSRSRELGMEPLVEIHSEEDGERAEEAGARIIVINNRDKDTLQIDLGRSQVLSETVSGLKISASGIQTVRDLKYVLRYCDAALIGTAIMAARDIEEKVREFVHG
jgi:indole-3-glycerol phosphate synthase